MAQFHYHQIPFVHLKRYSVKIWGNCTYGEFYKSKLLVSVAQQLSDIFNIMSDFLKKLRWE